MEYTTEACSEILYLLYKLIIVPRKKQSIIISTITSDRTVDSALPRLDTAYYNLLTVSIWHLAHWYKLGPPIQNPFWTSLSNPPVIMTDLIRFSASILFLSQLVIARAIPDDLQPWLRSRSPSSLSKRATNNTNKPRRGVSILAIVVIVIFVLGMYNFFLHIFFSGELTDGAVPD